MIKRWLASLVLALVIGVSPLAAPAQAYPSCDGTWSLGVGGLSLSLVQGSWEDSRYVQADEPIGFDSLNPAAGLRELDRRYHSHRATCPGDWVEIVGHSEGAGIVHAWVTEHQDEQLVSAVLLADPKQHPNGLASHPLGWLIGYPLAGTDAEFGSVPVLQVCHRDDVVCNRPAGWFGYVLTRTHTSYNTDPDVYPDGVSGIWFR